MTERTRTTSECHSAFFLTAGERAVIHRVVVLFGHGSSLFSARHPLAVSAGVAGITGLALQYSCFRDRCIPVREPYAWCEACRGWCALGWCWFQRIKGRAGESVRCRLPYEVSTSIDLVLRWTASPCGLGTRKRSSFMVSGASIGKCGAIPYRAAVALTGGDAVRRGVPNGRGAQKGVQANFYRSGAPGVKPQAQNGRPVAARPPRRQFSGAEDPLRAGNEEIYPSMGTVLFDTATFSLPIIQSAFRAQQPKCSIQALDAFPNSPARFLEPLLEAQNAEEQQAIQNT